MPTLSRTLVPKTIQAMEAFHVGSKKRLFFGENRPEPGGSILT